MVSASVTGGIDMKILAVNLAKHGFTKAQVDQCRKLALDGHQTGFVNNRFDTRGLINVPKALGALSKLAPDNRKYVIAGRKNLREKLEGLLCQTL